MKKFNVLIWDFNTDKLEHYDVLPYLRKECLKEIPKSKEELKKSIESNSMYRYWARCEYEIILVDWPSQETSKKIDVYEQIKINLDTITNILINSIEEN